MKIVLHFRAMKELLEGLRPQPFVDNMMQHAAGAIETAARQVGVSARSLGNQVLLHVPFHSEEEITQDEKCVIATTTEKAAHIGEGFKVHYDRLFEAAELGKFDGRASIGGRKILQLTTEYGETLPVRFGAVDREVAETIDSELHYIRTPRHDTLISYGLFMAGAEQPYASVSFSGCKRKYQVDSLNEAAKLELETFSILSMTRAFALDNAPKNSMSKLFHLSIEQIKKDLPEYQAVVTALNPFLGFEGGVFTGASFEPYALSPLEYWYDAEGYYVPRRDGVQPQRLRTPPILWLARGLDKQTTRSIETLSSRDKLITIDPQAYRRG